MTPASDGPPPLGVPRRYETHAPRLDRDHSNAGAFGRGIMAALLVAAAFVMIEGCAMIGVMILSVGRESITIATWVGLGVLAVAFGVAAVVSTRLPRAARPSFWAMGAVCLASVLIVLVGVCGMKVPRIGG